MDYYRDFLAGRSGRPAADAQEIVATRKTIAELLRELEAIDRLRRVGELAQLLGTPAVRRELGLSDAPPVPDDPFGAYAVDLSRMSDLTPRQRQARINTAVTEAHRRIDQALTPDQLNRLRQINRQLQGPRAVGEPETAARLALTDDQMLRLDDLLSSIRDGWQRLMPDLPLAPDVHDPRADPADPSAPPAEYVAARGLHAEARTAFLGLLTPGQRRVWDQLTGAPFPRQDVGPWQGAGVGPIFGIPLPGAPSPPSEPTD